MWVRQDQVKFQIAKGIPNIFIPFKEVIFPKCLFFWSPKGCVLKMFADVRGENMILF